MLVVTQNLHISCFPLPQTNKKTLYLWKHVLLSTEKCIWSESELPGEQLKTQHFCAGEILTLWKCLHCASGQHSIWNLLCKQRAEDFFWVGFENLHLLFLGKHRKHVYDFKDFLAFISRGRRWEDPKPLLWLESQCCWDIRIRWGRGTDTEMSQARLFGSWHF